jgi:hypothetical protein
MVAASFPTVNRSSQAIDAAAIMVEPASGGKRPEGKRARADPIYSLEVDCISLLVQR